MRSETARALEEIVGTDLDVGIRGPYMIGIDLFPEISRGVYVVFDVQGDCSYVGKICSDLDARRLERRMRAHLRDPQKIQIFNSYYVVPIRKSATNGRVERAEGWIGRHMRPYFTQRLPKPERR